MSRRSRHAQESAENRQLRRVVQRYRGCLGSLDASSQRLLSLRAGLHGSPRSAHAVARILHITSSHEQLLEQMSLVALQTTGTGGCTSSPAVTGAASTGVAQLTTAAPWVAPSSVPVSTLTAAPAASSSSSANGPGGHVGSGRSAKPVVITRSAMRTAEQAATGQSSLSWVVIAVLAMLGIAVSLVLLPGVRRRLVPLLAGTPSADGPVGPTESGMTPVVVAPAPARRPPASTPAPPPSAPPSTAAAPGPPSVVIPGAPAAAPAADQAPAPIADEAPAPIADEAPAPIAEEAPAPQAQPPSGEPQPQAEQSSIAGSWVREHTTQGALVATVIAGGVLRMLKRSRGR